MWRRSQTKALMVILCVATVYAAIYHSQTMQRARPGASSRPISLVAAVGERLVVLASVDGSTLPIDATMSGLYPFNDREKGVQGSFTQVSALAVTADGRSLIVVNGARDCRTTGGFEEGSYQPEIDRVVMETGARERIVGGSDFPVVSAKGVVVYGGVCDGLGTINFTDLVTGQNARRGAFGEAADVTSARPLAWLSDGRTLFYAVSVMGEAHTRYYFGLVWPLVSLDEEAFRRVAATLGDAGPDPTAATLIDDTTIAFAQNDSVGSRVRQWDIAAERFREDRSFRLPETVTALTADPSGAHLLAVTDRRVLYRWSTGETTPTRLAGGVRAAVWLP